MGHDRGGRVTLIISMRTLHKKWTAFLLALTTTGASAWADITLRVGDPAPKLQCGQFVQGDAVREFQPGKAYIVEFWATWCGPCRASIPHLNDIYNKYKDKGLVVIGQDCWENDEKGVAPFVKKMGDKMTYRVALDDKSGGKDGKMAETWMAAAGQNGIPTAFLISKDGRVAWIGHPMALEAKEEVIDQVLKGTYDFKKAAADYAEERKDAEARQKAMAPMQAKMRAMTKAKQEQKWDEALKDIDDAEKLVPAQSQNSMKLMFSVNRVTILLAKKDFSAAYKMIQTVSDDGKDNAMLQNYLAMQIIQSKPIGDGGLDLAGKLADRASASSEGKDPHILDTQARILFLKGQKEEAIKAQAKAVALASPDDKDSFQGRLDSYKKGQLPADN